MKINDVKPIIYNFVKNEMNAAYPQVFVLDKNNACSNIFWDRIKQTRPQRPYLMLTDLAPQKIYNRFERFLKDGKYYVRKEMRMLVTFGIYTTATENNLVAGDNQATELIEFIQNLFTEKESTFIALHNQGITINELESSNIRDLSGFTQTNQEFRKEIDIAFEFEDITQEAGELAKGINAHIQIDNTDEYIDYDRDFNNLFRVNEALINVLCNFYFYNT